MTTNAPTKVELPRLKQHRLTVLSLFSLIIFIASTYGWITSYFYYRAVTLVAPCSVASVMTGLGRFEFEYQRQPGWDPDRAPQSWDFGHRTWQGRVPQVVAVPDVTHYSGADLVDRRFAGFTYQSGELHNRFWALTFPGYLVVILSAILPLRYALNRRYWKDEARQSKGLCRSCGYDLRSSPDRCPECGAVVTPA
jgi:hypothetical protein